MQTQQEEIAIAPIIAIQLAVLILIVLCAGGLYHLISFLTQI